jgi:hypothetical protein
VHTLFGSFLPSAPLPHPLPPYPSVPSRSCSAFITRIFCFLDSLIFLVCVLKKSTLRWKNCKFLFHNIYHIFICLGRQWIYSPTWS